MFEVLFLEDDPNISQSVTFNMEQAGLKVTKAFSIKEAIDCSKGLSFDLILSDLMLPDGDGLDFTKSMRAKNSKTPIIILTAKTDENTVLDCFEAGVNDYVKKPFSNKELVARIKAHLPTGQKKTTISFAEVTISKDNLDIHFRENKITLSPAQHSILYKLIDNKDKIVTREMLLDLIGSSEDTSDRAIDSHISQLRRKLKSKKVDTLSILSIYSLGYRIEAN